MLCCADRVHMPQETIENSVVHIVDDDESLRRLAL
jgi:hypothetical protein